MVIFELNRLLTDGRRHTKPNFFLSLPKPRRTGSDADFEMFEDYLAQFDVRLHLLKLLLRASGVTACFIRNCDRLTM